MANDATYLPTPEEIREACVEIQRGWSEEERESRRVGSGVQRDVIPVVKAPVFREGKPS